MSFAWATAGSLLRAALVAGLALAWALPVAGLLRSVPRPWSRLAWALLIIPLLTPMMLVGYAYFGFAQRHPEISQGLYVGLLWMKLTPVAVLAIFLAPPPPVSREALWCHRMLAPAPSPSQGEGWGEGPAPRYLRNLIAVQARRLLVPDPHPCPSGGLPRRERGIVHRFQHLFLWSRGPARNAAAALGLVFVLAFQDFELASLLNISTRSAQGAVFSSWTTYIFETQATGDPLWLSLKRAVLPLVCEAAVVLPVLWVLLRGGRGRRGQVTPGGGPVARAAAWSYLGVAAAMVTMLPGARVMSEAIAGMSSLARQHNLPGDILASLVLAALAAVVCYLLSSSLVQGGAAGRMIALAMAVPGLLGALLLGLLVLGAFQYSGAPGYDTPVPLMIAMVLLLMPMALILRLLLLSGQPGESARAARLLADSGDAGQRRAGRWLGWELRGRARLWAVFLLFIWGYFDLTLGSLLSPSAITPAPVRLYNFMHYGQTAVLSAMVVAVMLAPLALLLVAGAVSVRFSHD